MFDHWTLRLYQIAREKPSGRKVKIVGAILLVGLFAAGIEALGVWPDWAVAERFNWRMPNLQAEPSGSD